MSMVRHFIDLDCIDAEVIRAILDDAVRRKKKRADLPKGSPDPEPPLKGEVLAMIFEKASTRTRVSFDIAIRQLGGQSILLLKNDMQLGRGESIADTARVMARYADVVMIRANRHADVTEFADHSEIPVINGLTDFSHPCQVLADIMTFEECCGPIEGQTIAWLGDGNNVAVSWIHAAAKLNFKLNIAGPQEFHPRADVLQHAREAGANIELGTDPIKTVSGANAVATDTWVSMGYDKPEKRRKLLGPYQVSEELMARAAKDAVFMHCLPAHRGEEVTDAVIDGDASVVWQEAENRLHAQKSILLWCLGLL